MTAMLPFLDESGADWSKGVVDRQARVMWGSIFWNQI